MTTTTALASVKNRLGITVSTFDTVLADFLQTAVSRLYPTTAYEAAAQTVTATPDNYGEATVDLSALSIPLSDVRRVEAYDGETWFTVSNIFRHGTSLRVRDLPSGVTQLKLFGLNPFALTSSAGTTTVPDYLQLPVFWFAMSEFYDYLLGSKANYNIYVQTTGARAVDNMRDEAVFYETKAINYIEENATAYGSA